MGAGVIALGLLAFDPTLLAHSSVATTDTGQALFMFWAIYAFYRYVKQPTAWRLVAVSVVVGLAIAAKAGAVQRRRDREQETRSDSLLDRHDAIREPARPRTQ